MRFPSLALATFFLPFPGNTLAFPNHLEIKAVKHSVHEATVVKEIKEAPKNGADRHLRGSTNEDSAWHKAWRSFAADVAMPVRIQNKVQNKLSLDEKRRLQQGEPCSVGDDGFLYCVVQDSPLMGFTTIVRCPADFTDISQCDSCSIIFTDANTPDYYDENDPTCASCNICTGSIAYDCSNVGDGECLIADCDGCADDVPPPPGPTTSPNPDGGGSGTCTDVPGWYDAEGDGCDWYEANNGCMQYGDLLENMGHTANTACCVCGGGNPAGGPGPTPGPDTAPPGPSPDEGPQCTQTSNGSLECVLEDFPIEGSTTTFGCPGTATSLSECDSCSIITPSNNVCDSCTVCADEIAWDCTNAIDGDCAIRDCNGNCSSGTGNNPQPSTPSPDEPTTPPDPSTPFPEEPTTPPVGPGFPRSSASTKTMGLLSVSVAVLALNVGFA